MEIIGSVAPVTLLGAVENNDYWQEFATLVVRDVGHYGEGQVGGKVQPCGTFVRTGRGWLEGSVVGGPQSVRLESHDTAPDPSGEWDAVAEFPYVSSSDGVHLTYVTGGGADDVLRLSGPGDYRVRAEKRGEGESEWRLSFWPNTVEPPVWLKRAAPPVRNGDGGWSSLFGYHAQDLLNAVWAARDGARGTTVEALARWGVRHHRGERWLDEPLPEVVPHELDPAVIASQVGVPAPTSLRGLLDVFAAAGALTFRDNSYHWPNPTPRAQDLVELPGTWATRLNEQFDHDRFRSFASDLVSVALWGGTGQSLEELAGRTLASEEDVRETLGWATGQDLLQVVGDLDGRFVMTPA